jgi:hypothetical protein
LQFTTPHQQLTRLIVFIDSIISVKHSSVVGIKMSALPRVVTVDPVGTIGRIMRAVIDLTDQCVFQIDVPSGVDALEEIQRTGCKLLITALQLDDEMNGIDLALRVKQAAPYAAVVILGDVDDPDELEDAYRTAAPFVYLRRPVDGAQFMRVLGAGLGSGDIISASLPLARPVGADGDLGVIPALDMNVAQSVVDTLLVDVGAMAIVVADRAGEVLLERGAVGYLDREQLAAALLPAVRTTVDMGQLVGGQPAALQFYDGDRYDVFVLSIGFHHFMCLVFDGQAGSRQFGAVNRFGRRAAEDLIAILGINAFLIAPSPTVEEPVRRRGKGTGRLKEEAPAEAPIEPLIARAEEFAAEPEPLPEPEPVRLEPIEDLDLGLFDKSLLENLDTGLADDLFDPEKLAEIANETRRDRGPLSYEEARELGIIP